MRIFDSDIDVKEEYLEAAMELNDRGMLKFKASVDLMRARETYMEVNTKEGEVGVREKFAKNSGKVKKQESDTMNNNRIEDLSCDEEEQRV